MVRSSSPCSSIQNKWPHFRNSQFFLHNILLGNGKKLKFCANLSDTLLYLGLKFEVNVFFL